MHEMFFGEVSAVPSDNRGPEKTQRQVNSQTRRSDVGSALIAPWQNRVKTLCVGAAGVSFERKADSPNC